MFQEDIKWPQVHEKLFNITSCKDDVNQHHNEISIIKKTRDNTCWQDWRKGKGTLYITGETANWHSRMENSMEIPQKSSK